MRSPIVLLNKSLKHRSVGIRTSTEKSSSVIQVCGIYGNAIYSFEEQNHRTRTTVQKIQTNGSPKTALRSHLLSLDSIQLHRSDGVS